MLLKGRLLGPSCMPVCMFTLSLVTQLAAQRSLTAPKAPTERIKAPSADLKEKGFGAADIELLTSVSLSEQSRLRKARRKEEEEKTAVTKSKSLKAPTEAKEDPAAMPTKLLFSELSAEVYDRLSFLLMTCRGKGAKTLCSGYWTMVQMPTDSTLSGSDLCMWLCSMAA